MITLKVEKTSIENMMSSHLNEFDIKILSEAIASGRGGSVFLHVFSETALAKDYNFAKNVMRALEFAMDLSPGVSGYFMARLYQISAKCNFYDICDSIDLWMENTKSKDLGQKLEILIKEPVRSLHKKKIRGWIEKVSG